MEQLDYRCCVGLNMDDPIGDVTVFTKNRQRLLSGNIAEAFFSAVLKRSDSEICSRMRTSPRMAPAYRAE
jgi:hypothetical protein